MRALKLVPTVALLLFCPLFVVVEGVIDAVASPVLVVLLVAGLLAVGVAVVRRFAPRGGVPRGGEPLGGQPLDVAAVRLAIDGGAREAIASRLAALALGGATKTKDDLVKLLRETVSALLAADRAWRLATVTSTAPRPRRDAEALFRAVTQEARAKFGDEVVRNVDGALRTHAFATEDDAPTEDAVVVVTLVVASRKEIRDLDGAPSASQVRDLLKDLALLEAKDLVALEVVWSPADLREHVTLSAVRRRYPELAEVRGVGLDGRVKCGYRCAPYDASLARCPSCGAPREG